MRKYTIKFDVHDEIGFLQYLQYIAKYAEYYIKEVDEGKDKDG